MVNLQDKASGNWWFNVNDEPLGYWPKDLVPALANGASYVGWGGLTLGPAGEPSPPMGNGHIPDGDFRKAGFFSSMKVVDATDSLVNPPPDETAIDVDCDNYSIENNDDASMNPSILYGGPGGMCP